MIKRFYTYNESVRDKMTPKPKEEVRRTFGDIIDGIRTPMTMYPMKIWDEVDEICEILGETRADLYIMEEGDDKYHIIEQMFESMIVENDQSKMQKVKGSEGEWSCYPSVKLAYFNPDSMTEPSHWIFCKSYVKETFMNESVRSKMTPLDKETVKKRKEELIDFIDDIVMENDGSIGMGEIESDVSPLYYSTEEEVHLIENLYIGCANVVVYGGYKIQDVLDEYTVKYKDMEPDILLSIEDVLNRAIEYGFLGREVNEGLRDKMTPKSKTEQGDILEKIFRDFVPLSEDPTVVLSWSLKGVLDKMGETKDNICMVEREDKHYKSLDSFFWSIAKGVPREMDNECLYWKELKLIYTINPTPRWLFSKNVDYINMIVNEGVRDKMTHKSEENIKKTIKESEPDRIIELLVYYSDSSRLGSLSVSKYFTEDELREIFLKVDPNRTLKILEQSPSLLKMFLETRDISDFESRNVYQLLYNSMMNTRTQTGISKRNGYLEVSKYLIDNIDNVNRDSAAYLRFAVNMRVDEDVIRHLLRKGADSSLAISFWRNNTPNKTDDIMYLRDLQREVLTESVRDKMTPKPREEMMDMFSGMTDRQIVDKLMFSEDALKSLYTPKEIKRMFSKLPATKYLRIFYGMGRYPLLKMFVKSRPLEDFNQKTLLSVAGRLADNGDWSLMDYINKKDNKEKVNEGVRDRMTPKSEEEMEGIYRRMTPRQLFLRSFYVMSDMGNPTTRPIYKKAMKFIKPFEDVEIGDLLTVSSHPNERQLPLYPIKEKMVFDNKEEYKKWKSENPKIIIADSALDMLFNNKRGPQQAVVVDLGCDVIFPYGQIWCGVFPYTEEELKLRVKTH
jgi:hypothetical protein